MRGKLMLDHSICQSYASILYLRIPPGFRIILHGKDVEHHNIVNDMMITHEVTYGPQPGADGIPRDSNMVAVVTIGFVKDAKAHVDVQGFNVYHKNQLIKDFYEDLFEELNKYGEIESLNICDNVADHMVGNVYVQFREEEQAANALKNLTGRFYAGRPIIVDFSPLEVDGIHQNPKACHSAKTS